MEKTAMTTESPIDERQRNRERERAFVLALYRLKRTNDRAALAHLRSGLGKPPGTAALMHPYVGRHLQVSPRPDGRLTPWEERSNDILYIVGALFALHPVGPGTAPDAATSPDEPATSSEADGRAAAATNENRLTPARRPYGAPFLASLRQLADQSGDDAQGMERRVVALLNAESDQLPTVLRHAVSLLRGSEIPVDWEQLIRDLNQWEETDRSVQKRWARVWWTAPTREQLATSTTDDSAS